MEFVTVGDVLVSERPEKAIVESDRLVDTGLPIWVIIDSARAVGFDPAYVADRYGLAVESVEAAFRYYDAHKLLIDAQISNCVESYS